MATDPPSPPAEVYSADATFASPRKLTDANPQLAGIALGESEVVTWKSPDGQEVEGVLLKPVGYRQGQRYPLLVDIHGGATRRRNTGLQGNMGVPGPILAGQGGAALSPQTPAPPGGRRE